MRDPQLMQMLVCTTHRRRYPRAHLTLLAGRHRTTAHNVREVSIELNAPVAFANCFSQRFADVNIRRPQYHAGIGRPPEYLLVRLEPGKYTLRIGAQQGVDR